MEVTSGTFDASIARVKGESNYDSQSLSMVTSRDSPAKKNERLFLACEPHKSRCMTTFVGVRLVQLVFLLFGLSMALKMQGAHEGV